jgi:curved DNA-binding protein
MISLHHPVMAADGVVSIEERQLEISIPAGIRSGQHLRLAGMGDPGQGGAPAGDLYLQIALRPHARFRVDGADVWVDLPVTPWEAALGATVTAPTPAGEVALDVPPGSTAGRTLRLKGRGLPGKTPGDLYAALKIALPPSDTPAAREAYAALGRAFPDHHPRSPDDARGS